MNKIDKYLRRFAYKIETSETKESRYYTIGDLIVRVSNHIGKNSSGNISIIIDRNNYILYVPSTNKVSLISYEECKTLIRGIVLHASLFLVGDSTYQKSLVKENEELKLQISNLKQKINIQEMLQNIPVRKDSEIWEPCTEEMYAGRAIVQSPILRGTKKSITKTQYILEDPNVQKLGSATHYQPQIAVKDTVMELGD